MSDFVGPERRAFDRALPAMFGISYRAGGAPEFIVQVGDTRVSTDSLHHARMTAYVHNVVNGHVSGPSPLRHHPDLDPHAHY